jgi:tRNA-specific 2-thiouridylase
LADRVGTARVDIVDASGAVVGAHEGAHAFTVGQRRGLALGVPAADGKPRFVLEVRPVSNTVVVGPREALAIAEISGDRFTWAGSAALAVGSELTCHVQIRAHADPVPATLSFVAGSEVGSGVDGDGMPRLVVRPDVPLDGVAPGQTAVLYAGTRVLGQFTIDRTVSAVPAGV